MRYIVDFYDGFDDWIYRGDAPKDKMFDDIDEARKCRDKKNAELNEANKRFGEHWGVIDTQINHEIECYRHNA